jgi:hypothetical protein
VVLVAAAAEETRQLYQVSQQAFGLVHLELAAKVLQAVTVIKLI